MSKIKAGDDVSWKWGKGTGEGTVTETFTQDVTRTIKGKTIKRKADDKEPAVLVRQEDGDRVLKSASEVRKTR
jgi:Hypervirulence associated proteins TUDOR domain